MNNTKTGGVIAGIIMVLVVVIFAINIQVIPAGYVGVQYNINKGVEEKVLGQGWHITVPTVKVKTYTVGLEQSYLTKEKKGDSKKDESFSASSSEGKALQIDLTYSYQFKADKVSEVFTRFKGQNGEDVRDRFIKPNIVSWTKEVISRYKVSDILGSERANVNTAWEIDLNTMTSSVRKYTNNTGYMLGGNTSYERVDNHCIYEVDDYIVVYIPKSTETRSQCRASRWESAGSIWSEKSAGGTAPRRAV